VYTRVHVCVFAGVSGWATGSELGCALAVTVVCLPVCACVSPSVCVSVSQSLCLRLRPMRRAMATAARFIGTPSVCLSACACLCACERVSECECE
jgi:hypothetical protein